HQDRRVRHEIPQCSEVAPGWRQVAGKQANRAELVYRRSGRIIGQHVPSEPRGAMDGPASSVTRPGSPPDVNWASPGFLVRDALLLPVPTPSSHSLAPANREACSWNVISTYRMYPTTSLCGPFPRC